MHSQGFKRRVKFQVDSKKFGLKLFYTTVKSSVTKALKSKAGITLYALVCIP